MGVTLTLNGTAVDLHKDGTTPLILALRNELGLKGTRFGCGGEDCGACMVLVDSEPRYSCTLQLDDVAHKRVTTIEGLNDRLSEVLRDAIVAESAGQCGYCLSGIFVTLHHAISASSQPTSAEVAGALSRHLCRCGANAAILRAVDRAIKLIEARAGDA
jgi:aerobic-type carbon monoxide dehydrogenase small subunit (CoxS/CutS family)